MTNHQLLNQLGVSNRERSNPRENSRQAERLGVNPIDNAVTVKWKTLKHFILQPKIEKKRKVKTRKLTQVFQRVNLMKDLIHKRRNLENMF